MKKLTQVFATCLLVGSISGVTFADGNGGVTQGPPAPPPDCTADCPSNSTATVAQPTQDLTVDIVTTAEIFAVWLAQTIL